MYGTQFLTFCSLGCTVGQTYSYWAGKSKCQYGTSAVNKEQHALNRYKLSDLKEVRWLDWWLNKALSIILFIPFLFFLSCLPCLSAYAFTGSFVIIFSLKNQLSGPVIQNTVFRSFNLGGGHAVQQQPMQIHTLIFPFTLKQTTLLQITKSSDCNILMCFYCCRKLNISWCS